MAVLSETEETAQQIERLSSFLDPVVAQSLDEAIAILDALAVTLRDQSVREGIGATDLPKILSRTLVQQSSGDISYALLAQVGRVAANLAADCDPNRDRLSDSGYPRALLDLLSLHSESTTLLPVSALTPLIASLLNLAAEKHAATYEELSGEKDLSTLIGIANLTYLPGTWSEDDSSARLGTWFWTIVSGLTNEQDAPTFSLNAHLIGMLLPALLPFLPRDQPTNFDPVKVDTEFFYTTDLFILEQATKLIHRFTATDKLDYVSIIASRHTLEIMIDFVHRAEMPGWLEIDLFEEVTEADLAKLLGQAKASVARSIVSLVADAGDAAPAWLWDCVHCWLHASDDRPDLVSCALLCYGNRARNDSAAESLLSGSDSLLPMLMPLLVASAPMIVQHAVIGLLRNLSIPPVNKPILGSAGVIAALVDMRVWSEERDIVGSVQGGAVGLIKNLCRSEVSNSVTFMQLESGVEQLHALMKRTNDGAVRLEATRVFVNAIRSLATSSRSEPDEREAWARLEDERVVDELVSMLATGPKYPVLVNESIIALALLATFSDKSLYIAKALNEPLGDEDSGLAVLCAVIAPAPRGPSPSVEVQANAVTLVRQLKSELVTRAIKTAVEAAQKAGSTVAEGVDTLI